MKCTWVLVTFLLISTFPALPAQPEPADVLLSRALRSAGSGKKAVFAGFHASWCGYCRRLERYLSSPEVKPIFERHFEAVWFTVQERGEKKALENPGALELMARWAGSARAGLPFFALLDSRGGLTGSSIRPIPETSGQNIGYPGTAEEVDHFLSALKKAAPALTKDEVDVLRRSLTPPAPR